jgi:hypothetical protein
VGLLNIFNRFCPHGNVGILEYWNIGKLGFGAPEGWVNERMVCLPRLIIDRNLQKPIIPSFHYAMMPRLG